MANPEHLEILKQGVHAWNTWKEIECKVIHPDLSGANLERAQLLEANLRFVDLSGANLRSAHLGSALLAGANLSGAGLVGTYLGGAELSHANLKDAHLGGASLDSAYLQGANFTDADLSGATLRGALMGGARFISAKLNGAAFDAVSFDNTDVSHSTMLFTSLGHVDLSRVVGLETVRHSGPSPIGIDTLSMSNGKIPEAFLRGCGLNDWQIESAKLYQPELSNEEITSILYRVHDLRAHQAIQISPLFISYSHADATFVDLMEAHLNERGVRFWRDVHHSTAGRLERQIDRAIRLNPTVLLVLSENSVKSDWVEHEARLARKLEQETGRDVLCPVALDDSWKTCRWPERLREQIMEYNVLDFSNWQNPDYMRRMFTRLIEGLGLFYK
jgi:hypothetical protein